MSTDQYGNPVEVSTWVQSSDGSVIAYTSVREEYGYDYWFSYVRTDGEVTNFLGWGYFTHVLNISGDGSVIEFSHPYGEDEYGFMTLSASAWDREAESFVDFAIGPDNQPLPDTRTNYCIGMSTDGSRVGLQSGSTAYVFDRTGQPPDELMARVPGTGAYGYNYDAWAADPVNTRTGAFELATTDASLPSRGLPAVMARAYSSDLTRSGRLGAGWSDTFASNVAETEPGAVTVLAPDGALLDFTEDGGDWTSAAALRATLEQTDDGWLLASEDGTAFSYDENGRLAAATTPDGQAWSVSWTGSTQTVTTTAGESLTLVENEGLLRTVTLPDGRQVQYGYTDGRLTSVTDAAGDVTAFSYDAAGRMTQLTDPTGAVQFVNTYGEDGRVAVQADATGAETTFYWDEEAQTSYVTGPQGDVWVYVYRGPVLMWSSDPGGVETDYVYDDTLNVIAATSARRTTTFSYDSLGHPVQAQWPDGTSLQVEYDAAARPLSVTDANGATTGYVYDARGHLVETHLPDGRITSNEWDPVTGDQTAAVSPAGRTTSFTHNDAGQVTSITTSEGRTT